ncbi:Uu.00g135290.m01.CDS01 [Anthostomella pinea]|uniref:Uu.00g135290.m01.CDS01 n=1 Tax=Anthostomella pinea TaxID=933095 RepID=A0AAI8VPU9_9PEZI|nr:Uu.00g135290.m01.CDS01 [Anthostomella pinea]
MFKRAGLMGSHRDFQAALWRFRTDPYLMQKYYRTRMVKDLNGEIWEKEKHQIVMTGYMHRLISESAFKFWLLGTGGKILVYASPNQVDRALGIGRTAEQASSKRGMAKRETWGSNALGEALMILRGMVEQLLDEEEVTPTFGEIAKRPLDQEKVRPKTLSEQNFARKLKELVLDLFKKPVRKETDVDPTQGLDKAPSATTTDDEVATKDDEDATSEDEV